MVEEEVGFFRNFFRRKTPTPSDRKVFNLGIQERDTTMWMSSPIIYHIASQSVILRTCTTQLKNEVFRRGAGGRFRASADPHTPDFDGGARSLWGPWGKIFGNLNSV